MVQESQKKKLEETACEPSNNPILYANNCGFINNPGTDNLCSKLYKDHVLSLSKDSGGSADTAKEVCDGEIVDKSTDGNQATREAAGVGVVGGSFEIHQKRLVDKCGYRRKKEVSAKAKQDREAIAKANPFMGADKIEKSEGAKSFNLVSQWLFLINDFGFPLVNLLGNRR